MQTSIQMDCVCVSPTDATLKIRDFTLQDLGECVRLFIDTYNRKPWSNEWTKLTAHQYLTEYVEYRHFIGKVLLERNVIAGVMFAHSKSCWDKDELVVDELFIGPEHQHKGYGEKLLKVAENFVHEHNYGRVVLMTNSCMPAKRFYEFEGYSCLEQVIYMSKDIRS